MKKIILIMIVLTFIYTGSGFADNPKYTLTVKNSVLINAKTLEFEIYLKHTNPDQSSPFKFLIGQYYLYFNTSYANGGTLTYTVAPGNPNDISDLPLSSQPRNPMVFKNILRIAPNSVIPVSNAPIISSSGNGTKILKMRLQTTASAFTGNLDLRWKNSRPAPTNIHAYVDGAPKTLTDSTGHFVGNSGNITLNLNCMIQGFYYPVVNSMIRDTVNVYLRNASPPFAVVDSGKTFLTTNGEGVINFNNASSGTYYMQVKHRNSIETWSKSGGQAFTSGGTTSYDFTTLALQAFGSNMMQIDNSPVRFGIFSGDVNQDGTVDINDASSVDNDAFNFESGYRNTDLDGDEIIDIGDAAIADNNSYNFVSKSTPQTVLRP